MHRQTTRAESLRSMPPASGIGVHTDPTKPARQVDQALTTKRMVTLGMLFPLFIMVMMPLVMTGMTHHLSPHDMKVAVIGSGDHDGVYFRNGNIVSGPDGMHAVIGDGPIKTVFGPHGKAHAIIENGSSGTVL